METIVVALGGNALMNPSGKQEFSEQGANMKKISKTIVKLSKKYNLVITHGNGSQVGDELMRNEHAEKFVPKLPFYILNAETQAQIGSVIETAMRRSIDDLKAKKDVCVILSHVMVDKNDHAFKSPTKQVGPYYTKKELDTELRLYKFDYIKIGAKYRRVVASPKPIKILEIDEIKRESKNGIVIAGGGGGIPVIGSEKGVDAVIDKDLTSQLIANSLKASRLVILTNAEYVYSDSNMKEPIKEIKASVLKQNLSRFEKGTIRPKLEACVNFIQKGGKEAYIGNILKLDLILDGKSGTKIIS